MSRRIFAEIEELTTEGVHPNSLDLDLFSCRQIIEFMSAEDSQVALAVKSVLPQVEKAVELVLTSFENGGRLIYIGAGTSGRLGVIDAAECPPTFGADPAQVVGIIAGGPDAVFHSQEGAEDQADQGVRDIKQIGLNAKDTLIGITASRRTPYVLEALRHAKSIKASTVFLCCNPSNSLTSTENIADIIITPVSGPEVVMGSTRLKAGTATKMILNMITTAAFIRRGKVYRGMMVDLKAWSEKLKARSRRILMLATGVDYDLADKTLNRAGGNVKTAIVMTLCGVDKEKAEALLKKSKGFIRRAINQ